MKHIKYAITPVTLFVIIAIAFVVKRTGEHEVEIEVEGTIAGYTQWLHETLADPATGKIPEGIMQQSLSYAATLPVEKYSSAKADYGIWVQRGPNNQGGRTRALAIDISNENRMVSGAVSGGIWKTEDGGGSWQKMSPDTDYTPVTCIVQDVRKGKTNTWYAGTGEIFGSMTPQGDYIVGNGIRKSIDNGRTWQRMTYTYGPGPYYTNSFSYVHRLAIQPSIDSIDVVYAAVPDGIFRSTDGGKNWIRKRGAVGAWGFTEVAIDKNGIVYAVMDGTFAQKGIWRSADNGQSWTNISPAWFTSAIKRTVMCISPNDPNQLYFFSYSPESGKKTSAKEWHSLWKYTYINGDGSGAGGIWEDRSSGIPTDTTRTYGTLETQFGYCMHVRVRPGTNEEVYLGGVDLFKSTDGYKTTNHIKHLGGYRLDATELDLQISVPNQHGDEHDIIFSPSNNKKAITVSDGGIEYTEDITAPNVTWQSMNAGYMTTQFYTVGIPHNSTSPIVFGGAQDNGARFVNDQNYLKPWTKPSDGDGMCMYAGIGSDDYYISFQYGWMARVQLDADMNMLKVAYLAPKRISPISLFASPFIVDESNRKRLFFADGQFIQRNDDITIVPLKVKIDSTTNIPGWKLMSGCVAPDSSGITHLTYAKAQTDVVYFGTNSGKVMRIRNASTNLPSVENITGSNFPEGYITCITTDEKDSNTLFCVFSNFGILSVFYTSNGGVDWTPVSGNLEQNVNGKGNGPSCRWITIAHLPDTTLYFLGTSTGLYATTKLDGSNTIWVRQGPHNIGFNWVTMMDFRTSDYTMAVATFGAGIFTSKISSIDRTGLSKQILEDKITLYPNPVINTFTIQLPVNWQQTPYEIINTKGEIIKQGIYLKEEKIDMASYPKGHYLLRLQQNNAIVTKRIVLVGG